MEKITEFCTGCRACEQLCPTRSITMSPDKEGFLMPFVSQETCIDCLLCQKRCPQNSISASTTSSSVYAFRNKDDSTLFNSASGGSFVAFACYIIENGGVVYGAAYVDDDLHVEHIRVDNLQELVKLQSSKYVQSNPQNTYSEVLKDLQNGINVLYSGTPCQIAGLKSFLKKDYDGLLTIDLICHGVPSPLLFEKYIQWMSLHFSKIVEYDFRDKSAGWGLGYKYKTVDKSKAKPGVLDPYYYHFLKGNTYRECCYKCKYTKPDRIADITIGDYWGIEKEHPGFYSNKGVSCILLNSKKGELLFEKIRLYAYVLESTFDKVAKHNDNLLLPTERHSIRNSIYRGLNEKSLDMFFSENMKYPRSFMAILKSFISPKMILHIKRLITK